MSQLTKYFEYLYCNLGSPYPITLKKNQFHLGIQDSAIGAYYVEPMRIKS